MKNISELKRLIDNREHFKKMGNNLSDNFEELLVAFTELEMQFNALDEEFLEYQMQYGDA